MEEEEHNYPNGESFYNTMSSPTNYKNNRVGTNPVLNTVHSMYDNKP